MCIRDRYWDGRDVTYDNLIWGTSGIEVPIKRILFQVELVMQEDVYKRQTWPRWCSTSIRAAARRWPRR